MFCGCCCVKFMELLSFVVVADPWFPPFDFVFASLANWERTCSWQVLWCKPSSDDSWIVPQISSLIWFFLELVFLDCNAFSICSNMFNANIDWVLSECCTDSIGVLVTTSMESSSVSNKFANLRPLPLDSHVHLNWHCSWVVFDKTVQNFEWFWSWFHNWRLRMCVPSSVLQWSSVCMNIQSHLTWVVLSLSTVNPD